MKKTEHVPSTGRPSRPIAPQNCPHCSPPHHQTLEAPWHQWVPPPPPPTYIHLLLTHRWPPAPQPAHTHLYVCSSPYLPPLTPSPPCSSCCQVVVTARSERDTHTHTHMHTHSHTNTHLHVHTQTCAHTHTGLWGVLEVAGGAVDALSSTLKPVRHDDIINLNVLFADVQIWFHVCL